MATVLLIEDDAESRRATASLFSRENWTILEAGDGEAGIGLALKHQPDLILCDLLMPKANGFQVCRNLRRNLQRAKIIIISGRDYGVDRASAIEAGADEYLVKPILWEHLQEVIVRVMPTGGKEAILTGPLPEFTPPSTRLKFWGVRGSIPVPGSSTVGYGGNTSCIEVRADGEIIILDAGSGMRSLGIALEEEFEASDQVNDPDFTYALGSHSRPALFPPGLQQQELAPRPRLRRGARRAGDHPCQPNGNLRLSGQSAGHAGCDLD